MVSFGFPVVLQWFPLGFLIVSQRFSYGYICKHGPQSCKHGHQSCSKTGTQARKTCEKQRMPTARLGHRRGKHTDSDAPAYDKAGAQTKTLTHSDAPDDDWLGQARPSARPGQALPSQCKIGQAWCAKRIACFSFVSRWKPSHRRQLFEVCIYTDKTTRCVIRGLSGRGLRLGGKSNHSINQSANQSITQSIHQLNKQSIN